MRKIKKPLLTLILTNTTNSDLPVQLLLPGNPNNIAGATTKYRWDITGISYAVPDVTLAFWPVGSVSAYTVKAGTMLQANAQGLVDLLNSFNAGSFWLETSGANTYLVTYNDDVVYGDLTVGTATTTITWSNTSTDGGMQIYSNLVLIINSLPSGSVNVNNGDNITGDAIFGLIGATITITKTLKYPPFTTSTIFTDSGSGFAVPISAFVIDISFSYNITLADT